MQTGAVVKDRHTQVSSPPGNSLAMSSRKSARAAASTKPIPAPRRKADNSLRANSSANNYLESDDEIVEIRFDDESSMPSIRQHIHSTITTETRPRVSTDLNSDCSKKVAKLKASRRSASIDCDIKSASIRRSMDEFRKREEDGNAITRDLERQLAEIRRLEERQRSILQNTLKQVVHSVNENQSSSSRSSLSASHKDELPMDSKIDYSSLLSPSFNRKTPLSSPLLVPRSTASPQSPRKLSATRRQDMQTISENGCYNIADLASMSPASSHRTLSNMASTLVPPRADYGFSMNSQSLPPRVDKYGHMVSALGDSFLDKNSRLSASYTELLPQFSADDRSGYFSDRESDRRRGGEDVKVYTDEARRVFLQFEIEKRRKQVDENNSLRMELQRLIQSGSIPAAKYDRLREMYREHINRSREYLGLSNSSLSSISTNRSMKLGYDGYTTDSDIMSSTEQLPGSISQSSTVERFMQADSTRYKNSSSKQRNQQDVGSCKSINYHSDDTASPTNLRSFPPAQHNDGSLSPMPLLNIRAPKTSSSMPNSTLELSRIGELLGFSSCVCFKEFCIDKLSTSVFYLKLHSHWF